MCVSRFLFGFFFFQAEDGIRDGHVTGVQTCALPISPVAGAARLRPLAGTVALLVIGIGSTGFDGASEGPLFNGVRPDLQDFFTSAGASLGLGLELAYVVGLL